MGLGGYHTIVYVSSYIESGVYKTSLRARFETNGDGFTANDVERSDSGGDCPEASNSKGVSMSEDIKRQKYNVVTRDL